MSPFPFLTVDVPAALEDEAVGALAGEGPGCETLPLPGGGRVRVRVWAGDPADREAMLARARDWLAARGLDDGTSGPVWEEIEDGRWVERYQRGLRPIPLGRRFVVIPRVEEPPRAATGTEVPAATSDGRQALLLVPGRAFGTGEHPTTRLCAGRLEELVAHGQRWLDIGCGSGVLALVAAGCGATEVLGVDNDADALEVARRTVATNGAVATVRLIVAAGPAAAGGGWDGVVCNVSERFVSAHAAGLVAAVRPGGRVLLSGFLAEDAGPVGRRLTGAGCVRPAVRRLEGWALVDAVRREAG